MTTIVTGAAGFIGFHLTRALLREGEHVLGLDNLNDYYSVALKEARLAEFSTEKGFEFHRLDLAEPGGFAAIVKRYPAITHIIHLAAQAGVRYSLENPRAYVNSNLVGQVEVLEACRHADRLEHLVFASSSSVYGGNTKLPFSEDDLVDTPQSLYAATKKADELMAYSYAHLYRIPISGLRFFTVYGPWGRPDMAAWLFTEAILQGKPIQVFNRGQMQRDFTYVDDIVDGVLGCIKQPPAPEGALPPYRVYNLGNHKTEDLLRFISIIEETLGRKAILKLLPMQPGDVAATYADIGAAQAAFGFAPRTAIDEGVPRFVEWYRAYSGR